MNPEEKDDSPFSDQAVARDITEKDWAAFQRLTSIELSGEERRLAAAPQRAAPEAEEFMALHWHPEWIPLDLIEARLAAAFPAAKNALPIPTQHNKALRLGRWAGVEADAYDRAYGQKVHLLFHFRAENLPKAGTFLKMMDRTYNYRAHQLVDILNRLAGPDESWAPLSFSKKAIQPEAARLARFYAIRLRALIDMSGILGSERDEMLKNRLLSDFMAARIKPKHESLMEQALLFIKAVKKSVKAELNPEAFYSPHELIEEARSFGAGVVIPHPPAFWPILLSDLDVDGWEIWNPSAPDHALFLAEALERANSNGRRKRKLLAFMGDDTHMSAKIRPDALDKKANKRPEIGFQDAWQDPLLAPVLRRSGQSRANTLNEYRARLLGA
jgi:hypothetical protein